MEPPSPARLYATAAGALLVVLGIVGFFYDASFTGLHETEAALGALQVNAWFNLLYIVTGAIGVLVAGTSSRSYSLAMGVVFTALGIFGLGTQWLHLAIGLLGFAAVAGTPKPVQAKRGRSKPRAKPVRERA
jgi:hypothetical protein